MANGTTYTVKAGDTLSLIARNQLGNLQRWPEIARLNGIPSPYTVRVGQTLRLPPRTTTVPVSVAQLFLGAPNASSRLATLQGQLLDLARQIVLAKQQGATGTLATLRLRYRELSAEAAVFRAQINRAEMPSTLLLQLDTFSDRVLDVGRQIGELPAGIGKAFRFLPVIIGGLAVLGVLAFLWAYRKR